MSATIKESWNCSGQIDRTPKRAVVTIHTSRPGIVIGKSGKEIAQLEEELKK